jgi:hypothetical protein
MFGDFKQVIIKKFEMTDIGLMTYLLHRDSDQIRRGWNLCKPREVCKRNSPKVEDGGL